MYYDPAVDKILYCAERGIPLINFPAPQGGATAPATYAGELVQGSAESLRQEVAGLRESAQLRAVIEQAKGALVARDGISLKQAFERLQVPPAEDLPPMNSLDLLKGGRFQWTAAASS